MKPDKYYGQRALEYDRVRQGAYWDREQKAVEALLTEGPVLDVPVGTGRYVDIYKNKGLKYVGIDISEDMLKQATKKDPDGDYRKGTIFELPFEDKSFGSVVCSRLMYFFEPDEMHKAMQELCRVARNVLVSIRLGKEGIPINLSSYTHDKIKFYKAVDNMLVEDRKPLSRSATDFHDFIKLRMPDFVKDFVDRFQWHNGKFNRAQELADTWFKIFNMKKFSLIESKIKVVYMTTDELQEVLYGMIGAADKFGYKHSLITKEQPKHSGMPPILISDGNKYAMIDGRRTTNQFLNRPGIYPVIVVTENV